MILAALATTVAVLLWASPQGSGPFSHKTHAPLKMKCVQCHTKVETAERAGFPAVAQCKVCHTEMGERTIPSQRLYEIRDFVVFSHARHVVAAKLECAGCHGAVYEQAVLKVERPTTMKACMDCHREHKATLSCTACHELGQ